MSTPYVPVLASAHWAGERVWQRYRKLVRSLAPPVFALAAAVGVVAYVLPSRVLALDGLAVAVVLLVPGISIGALTGPVTPLLYALNKPVFVMASYVGSAIVIGLSAAFTVVSPWSTIGVLAAGSSLAIAVQNLVQFHFLRAQFQVAPS